MRALLINPEAKTVSEIDHSGELDDMLRTIGSDAIDAVRLTLDDILWVDDEGHLKSGCAVFWWGMYPHPLAGNGVILGVDGRGANTPTTLTLSEVRRYVTWSDLETTGEIGELRKRHHHE